MNRIGAGDDLRIPPLVLEGWWMLHQFLRLEPGQADGTTELARTLDEWADLGEEGWTGLYRLVGGGGDFLMMHFRPSLRALGEVERHLRRAGLFRRLAPTTHQVSVVELSLYAATHDLLRESMAEGFEPGSERWEERAREIVEAEAASPYARRRLYPRQSEVMPYVCVYPMDRRRSGAENWYTAGLEDRACLMADHGATGRRYRGRVSQVISGSVGLSDREWAVTLFAPDPGIFKEIVTEMRYDTATALYGEFGGFRVGYRVTPEELKAELAGG